MNDEIDPTLLTLTRLAVANGHGPLDAPESLTNLDRAAMLMSIEPCEHCDLVCGLIPLAAARWGVEQMHEHHCPKHDDNTPGTHHDAMVYPTE